MINEILIFMDTVALGVEYSTPTGYNGGISPSS
jgi:hypothetical protein